MASASAVLSIFKNGDSRTLWAACSSTFDCFLGIRKCNVYLTKNPCVPSCVPCLLSCLCVFLRRVWPHLLYILSHCGSWGALLSLPFRLNKSSSLNLSLYVTYCSLLMVLMVAWWTINALSMLLLTQLSVWLALISTAAYCWFMVNWSTSVFKSFTESYFVAPQHPDCSVAWNYFIPGAELYICLYQVSWVFCQLTFSACQVISE